MRPGAVLAWLAAAVGVIASALAVLGAAWRVIRRLARFLDDWAGDDQRPGVIARLDRFEERLDRVEYQLHPNGGRSVADRVRRIERAVGANPPP